MFNKPSLSNRNDAITKKEVRNILGSTPTISQATPELSNKVIPQNATVATQAPQPANATEPTAESTLGARLIVGPDVKLKGAEILDCDTLVVEGRVEATMDSRVIRIADQGSFAGKVSGKIRYGKLVIDEGGELCGDINAITGEKQPSIRPTSEITPPATAIAD